MFTNLRELTFGPGAPGGPGTPGQPAGGSTAAGPAAQQAGQQAGASGGGGGAAGAAGAGGGGGAPDMAAALRTLSSLYKSILAAMREEAVVMEQVFPDPQKALGLYLQRIFEQRVGAALGAALRPPPRDAGHAAQQAHLNLLAEAYRKTRQLAADLQVGGQAGPGWAWAAAMGGPSAGRGQAGYWRLGVPDQGPVLQPALWPATHTFQPYPPRGPPHNRRRSRGAM